MNHEEQTARAVFVGSWLLWNICGCLVDGVPLTFHGQSGVISQRLHKKNDDMVKSRHMYHGVLYSG